MTTQNLKSRIKRINLPLIINVCALLGVVWLLAALTTHAAPTTLPPLTTFTPYPTEQATPIASPQPTPAPTLPAPPPSPTGGFIYLRVQSARQELWTIVQWQDGLGDWHDVEGWQGTLDDIQNEIGDKVWWVAKEGLGTGPFRWLVYQSKGGRLLATSEPFYLPDLNGGTVMVEVSPGP